MIGNLIFLRLNRPPFLHLGPHLKILYFWSSSFDKNCPCWSIFTFQLELLFTNPAFNWFVYDEMQKKLAFLTLLVYSSLKLYGIPWIWPSHQWIYCQIGIFNVNSPNFSPTLKTAVIVNWWRQYSGKPWIVHTSLLVAVQGATVGPWWQLSTLQCFLSLPWRRAASHNQIIFGMENYLLVFRFFLVLSGLSVHTCFEDSLINMRLIHKQYQSTICLFQIVFFKMCEEFSFPRICTFDII